MALSRYGGLRCPSEHLALTWADPDWERDRLRVTSPKTEHHEGKAERWVPIFPELRPYLAEAFERAPEGAVHIITCKRDMDQNLRTRLVKIIRRAGLTPWPKPFHNLRASRQTELAAEYPLHVVCAWLGNSALIAQKHYLQVTDADFRRAAQKAAQSAAERGCQEGTAEGSESQNDLEIKPLHVTSIADKTCEYARRDSNPQPTVPKTADTSAQHPLEPSTCDTNNNQLAPQLALDPDLALLVAAWPSLSAKTRRAILALIRVQ